MRPSRSSVTSLMTGRRVGARVAFGSQTCFRRRGGDTYALSSFCVCPSAALEQDQPDILVSWLPVLAVIPSDASQRFPAWIVRATLPRIPGESTQLLPLLCGCLMHCLYPPAPPVCVRRCVRAAPKPQQRRLIISSLPLRLSEGTRYASVVACRADDIRFQIYVQPG